MGCFKYMKICSNFQYKNIIYLYQHQDAGQFMAGFLLFKRRLSLNISCGRPTFLLSDGLYTYTEFWMQLASLLNKFCGPYPQQFHLKYLYLILLLFMFIKFISGNWHQKHLDSPSPCFMKVQFSNPCKSSATAILCYTHTHTRALDRSGA